MTPCIIRRRSIGVGSLLGQYCAGLGRVAERPRARKHVGKRIPRGLDLKPFALARSDGDIEIVRIGSHALYRSALSPELATNHAHVRAVVVSHLGNRARRNVLISRIGHLQPRGEVRPQLKAMHATLRVSLGHFLVHDAAAGRHPLHVAGAHLALVAQAVPVLHRTCQHVGNRLNPAMRMPRESRQVIVGIVIAEIVQQEERIEILGLTQSKRTLQLHPGAFQRRLRLNDLFHWSE